MTSPTRAIMKVYWQHIARYPWMTFFTLATHVTPHVLGVWYPLLVKRFFDAMTSAQGEGALQAGLSVLGILFILESVRWVFYRVSAFASSWLQPMIMADLERTAFTNVLEHAYRFHTNEFTGALVRKVKRLSDAYLQISDQILYSVTQLVVVLTGMLVIFATRSMVLAAILGAWSILFISINYAVARWKLKYDTIRAERDSESMGAISDTITNMVTVQQFAAQRYETQRFGSVLNRWRIAQSNSWYLGSFNEAVQSVFMLVLQFVCLYLALRMYSEGALTIGDIALVQLALFSLFGILWDFGHVIRRIYEGLADAAEMVEILQQPIEVLDAPRAKKLQVRKGEVVFDDVTFSYQQERPLLQHFTLTLQPEEKVAFVGPSGAGKSTVTKLLLRAFDVNSGVIRIDGQDIARVTQESLRKTISLVPQDPILFHRTLIENIRYGRRTASDAEVIAAAKKAHCHEFISQLPNGYQTLVGERGVKLSGGERQRVAIARAILKNAPILVLDEATSSLDSESEALIQDALRQLMTNKTVIVIAHRLSTIMQMDRIVVIENGAVSDMGTHEDLKKKSGTYSRLWSIQAGGFLP